MNQLRSSRNLSRTSEKKWKADIRSVTETFFGPLKVERLRDTRFMTGRQATVAYRLLLRAAIF
jgi:hypothetical protein